MVTAYIGLGANLGDREETLRDAVGRIGHLGRIVGVSSLYETAPVGFLDQPPYANAVVALETACPPVELMQALLAIERDLGRTRSFPNAPRTIDLDLLMVDDLVLEEPGLHLPHPRFHERGFVLAPLAEIAATLNHPVLGQTMVELLASLPDRTGVEVLRARGWERNARE